MSDITRDEFEGLKKKVDQLLGAQQQTPVKKAPRTPSDYNIFIKDEISRLKADPENAKLDHREIFTLAVRNWKKK